jgi:TfoX/Sxy family transcriptional regulator of competence genes
MASAGNQTDPAVLEAFDTMIAAVTGVERKGRTMPYVSINGNMFGMINHASAIGLRLSDRDKPAFVLAGATPFEGTPGYINKDYLSVPASLFGDAKALQTWFRLSYNYASKLTPKPTVAR